MKWLFAYDHKFFRKGQQFFSKQAFPYEMWQRYLEHCDDLIVTGRIQKLNENDTNYSLSSGNQLTFVNIPDASNLGYFLPDNAAETALVKEIKKVDAVIARIPSQIGYLAVKVAQQLNKPYAVEIVGDPKESYRFHGNWKAKLYAPLATRTMKKVVKTAPFALYITEKELQKLYPTKGIQTACSNVELTHFADDFFINSRKERDLKHKVTFGMIGSLDSNYKGLDIALQALATIKSTIPEFEFRVLGSGMSSKWQKLVDELQLKDNVIFCGTMPAEEVFDWLKDIDIYLQPSRTEGQGRSVIEAMAMGCPAITSNVGGMKELTDDRMRFPNGDEQELAKIIQLLLENNVIYQQQIVRNYQAAMDFSKEILEEKRKIYYKKFMDWIEENEKR